MSPRISIVPQKRIAEIDVVEAMVRVSILGQLLEFICEHRDIMGDKDHAHERRESDGARRV